MQCWRIEYSRESQYNYIAAENYFPSSCYLVFSLISPQEILVCGHSLEVNVTTNLDFFLNVAQVQLLQQLVQANMVGLEPSSSTTEVGFSLVCSQFSLEYHSSDQVFASSRQNYVGKWNTCFIIVCLVSFKMHSNVVLTIGWVLF